MKHKHFFRIFSQLCLSVLLLTSCALSNADYRADSFNLMQAAFDDYEKAEDLNMVVELKNVRVHIVGDRKYFQWQKASANDSRMLGYATRRYEIFVFGRRLGDKIVVNQAVLGHELNHLLNYQNTAVANPDRLKMLELEVKAHSRFDDYLKLK